MKNNKQTDIPYMSELSVCEKDSRVSKMNLRDHLKCNENILQSLLLALFMLIISSQQMLGAAYTWNGTTNNDWSVATNWTPNGIPTSVDNVTIAGGVNNPVLSTASAVTNLTLNSPANVNLNAFSLTSTGTFTMNTGASINLNGDSLILTGTATINGGTITNTGGPALLYGNTTSFIFGSAAGSPLISADVFVISATVTSRNTTYNGIVSIEKTGGLNDASTGNNTFNGVTTLRNSSTTGYFLMSNITRDIFNNNVTLELTSSNILYIAHNDAVGTQFNGNIILNSTGTGSIRIGQGTGVATLANTKTISIGSLGFTGSLLLRNLTQAGTTPQTLSQVTGTGAIQLQSGLIFNGVTTINFPQVLLNGVTFNDSATVQKNGAGNNNGTGNNTFNSYAAIINTGTGYLLTANTTRDNFLGDVNVLNSGTSVIYLAHNDAIGTSFQGNIILNNTGAGSIRFCQSNGTCSLANNKLIQVGGFGFASGALYLRNFTQTGTTSQTLTFTGTATAYFQTGTTFNGNVTVSCPSIRLDGATYNRAANFTKTGITNDAGVGGNTFNMPAHFINTGTGYLQFNSTGNDTYNDSLTLENTGGGYRFGQGVGTCTLASGKIFSIGALGFTAGALYLKNFIQTSADTIYIPTAGTASLFLQSGSIFQGVFISTAPTIRTDGSTFFKTVSLTKTGASNDLGIGGNVFHSTVSLINSGAGYLQLNGAGNDTFDDTLTLQSTAAGGFRFGQNAGTTTFSAVSTIQIGAAGFTNGGLYLNNVTLLNTNPQTLTLTSLSSIYFQTLSTFNGNLTVTAPTIRLDGSTFNGVTRFTKTGASNDAGLGGNVFNADVYFTVTGTGYIQSNGATNDNYNGNIIVENTGGGIRFGQNAGVCTLASGRTITVGALGFSAGTLYLRNFNQLGSTPQSMTLSGTAAIYLQTLSIFNGDVSFAAPQLYLNGATYNGLATLEKTGATNNNGIGGNTFNGITTIANSGSAYLLTANTTKDIFNADLRVLNLGASLIYLAYNDNAGSQFNGDIVVTGTGGTGISFGGGVGTSQLATGKTISVSGTGFTIGTLTLRNFTQNGTTPQSITLSGTASLVYGPASTFNGNVTSTSPSLFFNGCTYNGTLTATKNSITTDNSTGNNVFNGVTNITNSAAGQFLLANVTKDIFNADVTFTNTSTNIFYIAYNDATGSQFNGNIYVNTTSTGSIRFGQGTGLSYLASGMTINLGGLGFLGRLYLNKFIQQGTTAQSLVMAAGTANLFLQTGSIFNGPVNFSFPQVFLNGSTYNNSATIIKNGATNNTSSGANTFNGTTIIKTTGTGQMLMANTTADDFNGSVTFIQTGTGTLFPAYNTNCTFSGDISTVGTTTAITFGSLAGSVVIDGASPQNFNGASGLPPTVKRMSMIGAGGITLNVQVTITVSLSMTTGLINTSNANLLIIANGITTVAAVNNSSYVNGPVRKVGNQAFTFPVGKSGYYRPIAITAPTLTTDHFTAEYFPIDPNSSWDVTQHDVTINHISRCEYWILNRTNGASNVNVTLSWDVLSCGVSVLADLVVTRWDTGLLRFRDLGNAGTTGSSTLGTVISVTAPTAYGTFTFGSNSGNNPLPITLLDFNVTAVDRKALIKWSTASEINDDYYLVERSADGENYQPLARISGKGNSDVENSYSLVDENPLAGISFYRLRQTDFDGQFTEYNPVKFNLNEKYLINIGPNPFSSELHINLTSFQKGNLKIRLVDPTGKIILQQTETVANGNVQFSPNGIREISSGLYFLQIFYDDKLISENKVIKN